MARGIDQTNIFVDDADRAKFLGIVESSRRERKSRPGRGKCVEASSGGSVSERSEERPYTPFPMSLFPLSLVLSGQWSHSPLKFRPPLFYYPETVVLVFGYRKFLVSLKCNSGSFNAL